MHKSAAVDVYRKLASLPTLAKVRVCGSKVEGESLVVESDWSQVDIERASRIKYRRCHLLDNGSLSLMSSTSPQEINNEVCNELSPTGKFRIIVRTVKVKEEEKQFIEVWSHRNKMINIDVKSEEVHGDFYTGEGLLGSVRWSADEKKVAYIAERYKGKPTSYFDTKLEEKMEKDTEKKLTVGSEFDYEDSWGEQLSERVESVICVLERGSGVTRVVDGSGIPTHVMPTELCWTPEGDLLFVGLQHEPYKVGAIYCQNRPSQLYHLQLATGACTPVFISGKSVRSPRFSPNGQSLLYLENDCFGPHMQGARLHCCCWLDRADKVVVDLQASPPPCVGVPSFPGLYTLSLPGECWLRDSQRLVLHSVWRSSQVPLLVDTASGCVTRLCDGDAEAGCYVVHVVRGDVVVASRATPNTPPYLVVSKVGEDGGCEWRAIDSGDVNRVEGVVWQVLQITPSQINENPQHKDLVNEAILVQPSPAPDHTLPLIVTPHGGPHTAFTGDYIDTVLGFSLLGYAVLLVNYRGSLGFGGSSVHSLPGNVGSQDVRDVQDCCEEVLRTCTTLDPHRVYCSGGSHGGFLVTHLLAQFPSSYKACATRNPVTNMASLVGTSDIPDWSYVEGGGEFAYMSLPSPALYGKLWSCSPLSGVDQVVTPLLLQLGADDLRVPPSQGLEYYRALKARGKPVKLLWYKNNSHPISNLPAAGHVFVQTYEWFQQHK